MSNLVLVFLLYSLSRWFYYMISRDVYPDVTTAHLWEMLFGGMRFDVTALFYLNSVYMLLMFLPNPWRENAVYQRVARAFYLVPNIVGLIANTADMVYVRFTSRRTTMTFFSEFENDDNLVRVFLTSMVQYWYVTLFGIAVIALLMVCMRRKTNPSPLASHPKLFYPIELVLMLMSWYFVVIGIRSGFGAFTRPITLSNAQQYVNRPAEANIVLNTPFSIMRSSEGRGYKHPHYMSDEQMQTIYTPCHEPSGLQTNSKNVVVLILESFAKEHVGYYNHDLDDGTYVGYTPFLDSLIEHSVTYRYSFATGRKSIDAMPSVLAGLPRIGAPYILTPYSSNDIPSLPRFLKRKGYTTAFFHGAPNGSMGFQAFARSAGFDAYYGKTEYNNNDDYDGYWAIWDEEFLQYFARTMSSLEQPFMTSVFTATSHHPFQIPARYEGVFPEGPHPLQRCIGYTDHALREFFRTASRQPWFMNTLFVLVADHTNGLTRPEYLSDRGCYEVPIIFYDPATDEHRYVEDFPVCQADIMPSVLAYLGYDMPYTAFGDDILTTQNKRHLVVLSNEPCYQTISDRWILFMSESGEPVALYDYQVDRMLKNNVLAEHVEDEEVQYMLTYTKAFVQQYISRMINNKLMPDGAEEG